MLTRTTRSRQHRLIAGLAGATLLIAACGNSDDDADSTEAPAEDTAAADTAAPEEITEETEAPDDATEETAAPEEVTEETEAPDDTEAPEETTAPTEPAVDEPELGEFVAIEGVPGVTDEQIGFGVVGTGPANPLGYCLLECYVDGIEAYFAYRNELGGVDGRQLALTEVLDDELANNQVRALELIDSPDVFGAFFAPIIYPGLTELNSAGVPTYTIFPASPEANGFEAVYVPSGTLCLTCPRPHDVEAAVLAGATKVAALGFGVSQASKDCVANKQAAYEQWGPAVGIEFVYANDLLEFGLPNGIAPEVTAMGEAGVDFILNCIDQNSALLIEQELERQGMTDVTMIMPQGYGDDEFISTNAALLEGDILGTQFRPLEADPADTIMSTMLENFEGLDIVNDYTVQGWIGADLAVQGILAAGPEFDRASVIAATNEITDWTAGGLVPPVDWTRQHNAATPEDPATNAPVYDCFAYLQVQGGELVVLGESDAPFNCFETPVTDWTDSMPMSFE